MRLVTYTGPDGQRQRVGVVEGNEVAPVTLGTGHPDILSMREVISLQGGKAPVGILDGSKDRLDLTDARLLAPIPDPPGNVICLGRNYAEHAEESARARGEEVTRPTFFSKAITSIIGPYDAIPYDRSLTEQLDWEVELAVVIGTRTRNVSVDQAIHSVFGYMVVNDISARDLQFGYGGQFFYGKSLDGSCPIGPWIVTADEVPDPQDLAVRLRVDGVTKQDDSTRNMIFSVAECIATLSRGMTLIPGQIIATGTPVGVGFARTPAEYLQPANVVEAEIEGIGMLRNTVVEV